MNLKFIYDFNKLLPHYSGGHSNDLLQNWQHQDEVVSNDFEFLEPVLSQRCVLLQLLLEHRRGNAGIQEGLVKQLTRLTKMARQAGQHQVS